ncbi:hypothetical protein M427DRAFT_181149 [Gonapodya prolifera JEL478]|uniref:C2 NT-type domain-containing protein n=1 Tax=Gonapodya prolifera (strain JEL478) TaxID=1344416 RepID=A0A139AQJ2_GONPJ|nr:hypothetical protein M427DRAFT_181149 [Gonapodya prolifera JEL478]|eukprot:KXS19006.1 hypothetical protein M427DRAFT_181149 [Gonapodya prolifera JEL478]
MSLLGTRKRPQFSATCSSYELTQLPFLTGLYYLKWKIRSGGSASGKSPKVSPKDHIASWPTWSLSAPISPSISRDGVLQSAELRIIVKQELNDRKTVLGMVSLDLSAFAGIGGGEPVKRSMLLQESKINAFLNFSVHLVLLSPSEIPFIPPPLSSGVSAWRGDSGDSESDDAWSTRGGLAGSLAASKVGEGSPAALTSSSSSSISYFSTPAPPRTTPPSLTERPSPAPGSPLQHPRAASAISTPSTRPSFPSPGTGNGPATQPVVSPPSVPPRRPLSGAAAAAISAAVASVGAVGAMGVPGLSMIGGMAAVQVQSLGPVHERGQSGQLGHAHAHGPVVPTPEDIVESVFAELGMEVPRKRTRRDAQVMTYSSELLHDHGREHGHGSVEMGSISSGLRGGGSVASDVDPTPVYLSPPGTLPPPPHSEGSTKDPSQPALASADHAAAPEKFVWTGYPDGAKRWTRLDRNRVREDEPGVAPWGRGDGKEDDGTPAILRAGSGLRRDIVRRQ